MEKVFFAIFGVIVGWIASQYRLVISENANLINEHVRDMESFSDSIQEYWLTPANSLDEELIMAARVRAKHAAVSVFYGEAMKRLTVSRLREYQVLQVRLFKTAMGGDFETKDRPVSPIIAIESYQLCSEIIHGLRLARKEQISLTVLFSKAWNYLFPGS